MKEYLALLDQAEQKYGLPKGLLVSQMKAESNGNINAISPKGAKGLMQFMPATASELGIDPNNPEQAIDGAGRYMKNLIEQTGSVDDAVGAYNWGIGNVKRKGMANAPKETKDYVTKVTGNINQQEDLTALWESAAPQEDLTALWDSAIPEKLSIPNSLSVTRNGKTLTASNKTFEDDLKYELTNPSTESWTTPSIDAKLASAGTALTDMYYGGKQLLGIGDKKQLANKIDEQRIIREANPGSAIVGNVALGAGGGVAAPVLNTAKGIVATGAVIGGLSPTEKGDFQEHLGNALIGGATGALANKVLGGATGALTKRATDKLIAKSQNATRDASIKELMNAGYVAPRSLYNPSFISNKIESFAGKAASKQDAALRNQEITNSLAKKYLGINETGSLSDDMLSQLRFNAAAPYREAADLPIGFVNTPAKENTLILTGKSALTPVEKTGAQLIDEIKTVRDEARSAWRSFDSGNAQNPTEIRNIAVNADKEVARLESQLDDLATKNNKPYLVEQLRNARKDIAKIHTIDDAMNIDTGNVMPQKLASMLNNGKKIDDEARTIAKYANTFKPLTGITPQGAGVSYLDAVTAAALAGAGGYSTESPYGTALGLIPLLGRPAARSIALSKLLQKTPNYSTGAASELLKALSSSRYAPMAITAGAVPSLTK